MRVFECDQNTGLWIRARIGRVTASRIAECASRFKNEKRAAEETAERRNFRIDLLVERLTGRSTENFTSPEMVWGTEHESEARIAYEEATEEFTEKVGFIIHPKYDWCGASPDALVSTNGGLEIKCPKSATHWKWRAAGIVPPEHMPQVQSNIDCSEREWWDFMSYDPRLPEKQRRFIVRAYRDQAYIDSMMQSASLLHEQIEEEIAKEGLPPSKFAMPGQYVEIPEEMALPAPDISDWASAFDEFMQGEVAP